MKPTRQWLTALVKKTSNIDGEVIRIACIKITIVLIYAVLICYIIAGMIRHW